MEKRRVTVKGKKIEKKETDNINEKKMKINIVGALVILTIIVLLCIYTPRAMELYNRYNIKGSNSKEVVYPLEIKLEAKQILDMNEMIGNYFIGIKNNVDSTDEFTNKEMIEFALNVLSGKYSSSGIVPSVAMDSLISRYFGVEKIDYKKEGYKTLKIKVEAKTVKSTSTYLFYNIKQLEKDSDMYEIEAHEVLLETAKKDAYDEKDIISKRTVLVRKITNQDGTTDNTDKYIFVKTII